jgi:hypothetical protein
MLIPGGCASPGTVLSLGMLFRERRALLKHLSRPLVDFRQALGYLPRTSSVAFRGCHLNPPACSRRPARRPRSGYPRHRGLSATHALAVTKQHGPARGSSRRRSERRVPVDRDAPALTSVTASEQGDGNAGCQTFAGRTLLLSRQSGGVQSSPESSAPAWQPAVRLSCVAQDEEQLRAGHRGGLLLMAGEAGATPRAMSARHARLDRSSVPILPEPLFDVHPPGGNHGFDCVVATIAEMAAPKDHEGCVRSSSDLSPVRVAFAPTRDVRMAPRAERFRRGPNLWASPRSLA